MNPSFQCLLGIEGETGHKKKNQTKGILQQRIAFQSGMCLVNTADFTVIIQVYILKICF